MTPSAMLWIIKCGQSGDLVIFGFFFFIFFFASQGTEINRGIQDYRG
jgi:hypothetical protein